MIRLQTVLLLSLGITMAAAWDPDCYLCKYFNGIGYIASDEYCPVYYMCIRNPYFVRNPKHVDEGSGRNKYEYRWYTLCCPEGMTFDEEHQTCVRDVYRDSKCINNRYKCPNVTAVPPSNCSYYAHWDETKYKVETGDVLMCPYGTVWDQRYCTCVFGKSWAKEPCCKILHYDFNNTFDSWSCYNHASGVPYGNPAWDREVLCLNGVDQFLTIPFLNNWFAWNPIGKTFTICFWLLPRANQTAGVLSTNCFYENEGSVAEVWLDDGELVVKLGTRVLRLWRFPPYSKFTKLCIVFNKGWYHIYYNGRPIKWIFVNPHPVSSHSATTLGFVRGKFPFKGYIDDFCFWTKALDARTIYKCFKKGPSNYYTSD